MKKRVWNVVGSKRFWQACGVAVLGLLAIFIISTQLNRTDYINQIEQTRLKQQDLKDKISQVLSPIDIEIGQKDLSVQYLVQQLTAVQKENTQPILPPPALVCIGLLPSLDCNGYLKARSEAAESRQQVYALIDYHRDMMNTLKPFLEYNPQADLGDERLNQPTIQTRIDAAKVGLRKAEDELVGQNTNTAPGDDGKAALLDSVRKVRLALNEFDKSRDKGAWYTAVETAQKSIVTNRETFWQFALKDLYEQIDSSNELLAGIGR